MHTNLKPIHNMYTISKPMHNMHANLKSIHNMHTNLKPIRDIKIIIQNDGVMFIYGMNLFFCHQKVTSNKFLAESH